jgi:hypothetical protein
MRGAHQNVTCAAFECPNVVICKAMYCFGHTQAPKEEFGGRS